MSATTEARPMAHTCRTCGARPGEPCRVTDSLTAQSDRWREYRALNPHPSRGDKQTHYGREEYADPFDVEADWEERA